MITHFFLYKSSDITIDIICICDVMLGENGDKLVGEWRATVSGDVINCERSNRIPNGYICSGSNFRAPVTWNEGIFTWNNGTVTGTIASNVMTWNTGSIWEKRNDKK